MEALHAVEPYGHGQDIKESLQYRMKLKSGKFLLASLFSLPVVIFLLTTFLALLPPICGGSLFSAVWLVIAVYVIRPIWSIPFLAFAFGFTTLAWKNRENKWQKGLLIFYFFVLSAAFVYEIITRITGTFYVIGLS